VGGRPYRLRLSKVLHPSQPPWGRQLQCKHSVGNNLEYALFRLAEGQVGSLILVHSGCTVPAALGSTQEVLAPGAVAPHTSGSILPRRLQSGPLRHPCVWGGRGEVGREGDVLHPGAPHGCEKRRCMLGCSVGGVPRAGVQRSRWNTVCPVHHEPCLPHAWPVQPEDRNAS